MINVGVVPMYILEEIAREVLSFSMKYRRHKSVKKYYKLILCALV